MPAVAAPCLLARSQPHRRSLLQGEEPHQEGEGEDAGSAIRGYRWGAGGDQQGGRPRFLRGLRLRRISGPLIMKIALGSISARRFAPCQHAQPFRLRSSAFQLFAFADMLTSEGRRPERAELL